METLLKTYRKPIGALWLSALILLPIILWILPSNYFDEGESVCLSVRLLDAECYACGMTSAIMHLMHFDFELAYAYNMLSFIVLPALFMLWLQYLKEAMMMIKQKPTGS